MLVKTSGHSFLVAGLIWLWSRNDSTATTTNNKQLTNNFQLFENGVFHLSLLWEQWIVFGGHSHRYGDVMRGMHGLASLFAGNLHHCRAEEGQLPFAVEVFFLGVLVPSIAFKN